MTNSFFATQNVISQDKIFSRDKTFCHDKFFSRDKTFCHDKFFSRDKTFCHDKIFSRDKFGQAKKTSGRFFPENIFAKMNSAKMAAYGKCL